MITQELAIMFGIIAIIFAAVICILLKKGVKKTALVCIFIAYITAVVCIVFFPIPYASDPIEYLNGYTWYNFVPFAMITEALVTDLVKRHFYRFSAIYSYLFRSDFLL